MPKFEIKMHQLAPNFSSLVTLVIALLIVRNPDEAFSCSSRTIPRARPSTSSSILATPVASTVKPTPTTTSTTQRPNITFPTYKCPTDFDRWYCLNAATCFSIKIGESVMYNCECALGFMGPRCEYKELDGSYLPQRPRPVLEKAGIASGAACALFFMFFICLTLYLRYDHQQLKCVDDDSDLLKMVNDSCEFNCRYCSKSNFSCQADNANLLASAEKYQASALRQYFQNISPLSFATRRPTKY